jgi:hypothetical protein
MLMLWGTECVEKSEVAVVKGSWMRKFQEARRGRTSYDEVKYGVVWYGI